MIKVYNTPKRALEDFHPISENEVTLYTCGPTVYDHLHVGNWVSYIRWDTLVRVLELNGYSVKRVMNITDVGHLVSDADEGEDKLEKGAQREGKSAWDVAKIYSNEFFEGMKELNLLEPSIYAKATEHIPHQVDLIKKLEEKGFTYVISDGVYFDTSKFPTYADFAKLDLADQKAGARININPEKRNPSDFALWKFSPEGKSRDMEWDSPWGKGFPGWHIECSAMAMEYLGETIDIHTGGIDHIPVHHTNEIAQSEAATGKRFVNYWLHNNFLLIDGTKISKSLNNGITLDEVNQRGFSVFDFKMFVLQSHYRTESNFTWENLEAAKNRLARVYALADLRWQAASESSEVDIISYRTKITDALSDDLNTPVSLSFLSEVSDQVLSGKKVAKHDIDDFVEFLDKIFGFNLSARQDISDEQKSIISSREEARKNQDFARSDELRAKLKEQGIELNDTSLGPIWSRV